MGRKGVSCAPSPRCQGRVSTPQPLRSKPKQEGLGLAQSGDSGGTQRPGQVPASACPGLPLGRPHPTLLSGLRPSPGPRCTARPGPGELPAAREGSRAAAGRAGPRGQARPPGSGNPGRTANRSPRTRPTDRDTGTAGDGRCRRQCRVIPAEQRGHRVLPRRTASPARRPEGAPTWQRGFAPACPGTLQRTATAGHCHSSERSAQSQVARPRLLRRGHAPGRPDRLARATDVAVVDASAATARLSCWSPRRARAEPAATRCRRTPARVPGAGGPAGFALAPSLVSQQDQQTLRANASCPRLQPWQA